jgi:hypothetical protein
MTGAVSWKEWIENAWNMKIAAAANRIKDWHWGSGTAALKWF